MTLDFLLISIFCLVGYFIFRYGMVTRSLYAPVIEFVGGSITFFAFVAITYFLGWKPLLGLVLVFWIIITPLVESLLKYLQKTSHDSEKAQYERRRRNRQLAHKKEDTDLFPDLFLILGKRDKEGLYHVYLANTTDQQYTKVKKLTGAFTSVDDDLLETSKAVFDLPDLLPRSCIEIDDIDWQERDFTVWYQLDLATEQGSWRYLSGSVPKHLPDGDMKHIEQFEKEGWILKLKDRNDQRSIDEMTKSMHMESRYISFTGNQTANE